MNSDELYGAIACISYETILGIQMSPANAHVDVALSDRLDKDNNA